MTSGMHIISIPKQHLLVILQDDEQNHEGAEG